MEKMSHDTMELEWLWFWPSCATYHFYMETILGLRNGKSKQVINLLCLGRCGGDFKCLILKDNWIDDIISKVSHDLTDSGNADQNGVSQFPHQTSMS